MFPPPTVKRKKRLRPRASGTLNSYTAIDKIAKHISEGVPLSAACRLEGKNPSAVRAMLEDVDAGHGGPVKARVANKIRRAEAKLEAEMVAIIMSAIRDYGPKGFNTLRFFLERRFGETWGAKMKLEHSIQKSAEDIASMTDAELEALISSAKR